MPACNKPEGKEKNFRIVFFFSVNVYRDQASEIWQAMGIDHEQCDQCKRIYADVENEGPFEVKIGKKYKALCIHCIRVLYRNRDMILRIDENVECVWKLLVVGRQAQECSRPVCHVIDRILDITPLQIQLCNQLPDPSRSHYPAYGFCLYGANLDNPNPISLKVGMDILDLDECDVSSCSRPFLSASRLRDKFLEIAMKICGDTENLHFDKIDDATLQTLEKQCNTVHAKGISCNFQELKAREDAIFHCDLFSGIRELVILVCDYDHGWQDLGTKHKRLTEQTEKVAILQSQLTKEETRLQMLKSEKTKIDAAARTERKADVLLSITNVLQKQMDGVENKNKKRKRKA